MENHLNHLAWSARRILRQLGLLGCLGTALLAVSLLTWLTVLRPQHLELAALAGERTLLEAQASSGSLAPAAVSEDPETQLGIFYRFLVPDDAIALVLQKIQGAAAQNGVVLAAGEFKLIVEPGGRVGQYQMVFPLKAEYHQVRGFLRQVLKENPQIALEEIGMRRDDPANAILDARVRLALYLAERR